MAGTTIQQPRLGQCSGMTPKTYELADGTSTNAEAAA